MCLKSKELQFFRKETNGFLTLRVFLDTSKKGPSVEQQQKNLKTHIPWESKRESGMTVKTRDPFLSRSEVHLATSGLLRHKFCLFRVKNHELVLRSSNLAVHVFYISKNF